MDKPAIDETRRSIKDELEDIRQSIDRNTRTQRNRSIIQWTALAIVMTIGFLVYKDDENDDKREKVQLVEQRLQDCMSSIDGRDDAEDRLVDLAHNLGASDATINAIHKSYNDAPTLPACEKTADSGN